MLEKLFEKVNSELLTDEVKVELSTIFESQLNEAIAAKEEALEEANATEISTFKEEMVTKLDEYLAYFVEEFTKEQEDQIVEATKVERATEVLDIFSDLVSKFNMKLSEESFDGEKELESTKAKLSENTETILSLRKEVETMKVAGIVEAKAAEFDVDTEQEKFRALAETVSYEGDEEAFGKKLDVLASSIKEAKKDDTNQGLEEEEDKNTDSEEQDLDEGKQESSTDRYMKYL